MAVLYNVHIQVKKAEPLKLNHNLKLHSEKLQTVFMTSVTVAAAALNCLQFVQNDTFFNKVNQ